MGRTFVATERVAPRDEEVLPSHLKDAASIRSYVMRRFMADFAAMQPEFSRLRALEKLYSGYHYSNANDNFENEVTNYCFSVVETVWPELISERPRPIIVPRTGGLQNDRLLRSHAELATWLMDVNGFDLWRRNSMRAKLKYGWNASMQVVDKATGIPYPKHLSNFSFIPDLAATSTENAMRFTVAGPVSTELVRAMFPKTSNGIMSDNFTGPGFDALNRIHRDYWMNRDTDSGSVPFGPVDTITNPGEVSAGSSWMVPGGGQMDAAGTTFLIQMFVRDLSTMPVIYGGEIHHAALDIRVPAYRPFPEYSCPSGWRVLTVTASGRVLGNQPLDPCWGGINLTVGYDYRHEGRFFGLGEIDQIASKNRAINNQYRLLNRAMEYMCVPILVADRGAGMKFDKGTAVPGEVIRKTPGAEVEWLTFQGPNAQQFELMASRQHDLDVVSGVQPGQRGERQPGVEAAAGLRAITEQALARVRGKVPELLTETSEVLKKMMLCLAKKGDRSIVFKASNGAETQIDWNGILYDYDIRWVPGTATSQGMQDRQDFVLALHAAGIVDSQYVIEHLDLPGQLELLERMSAAPPPPPSSAAQLITAIAALIKADPSSVGYPQEQQALAMGGLRPQPMDTGQRALAAARLLKARTEAMPKPEPEAAGKSKGPSKN